MTPEERGDVLRRLEQLEERVKQFESFERLTTLTIQNYARMVADLSARVKYGKNDTE